MGYIDFETPNAKYRVELVIHQKGVKDFGPGTVDAFVCEGSTAIAVKVKYDELKLPHFRDVANHAREQQKPLYFADVQLKPSEFWKAFRTHALRMFGVTGALSIIPPLSIVQAIGLNALGHWISYTAIAAKGKIKKREIIRRAIAGYYSISPDALAEARNALVAEKIDSHIAHELRRQLGRKPVIHISYGVGHAGLVENLQNPILRSETLGLFSPLKRFYNPAHAFSVTRMDWNPREKKWNLKVTSQVIREKRAHLRTRINLMAKPAAIKKKSHLKFKWLRWVKK